MKIISLFLFIIIVPRLSLGQSFPERAFSIASDNDMFSSSKDRDYSASLSFKYTQEEYSDSLYTFDFWPNQSKAENKYFSLKSIEFGFFLFTPQDISNSLVIKDDRPYSSLVYVSITKQSLDQSLSRSIISSLTLGILGTKIPKSIQNNVHKAVDSPLANGWDNQISNGGEPTILYKKSINRNIFKRKYYEANLNYSGSLGFLTELSSAISHRFGIINSNWYRSNSDPSIIGGESTTEHKSSIKNNDFYIQMGLKLRYLAYNAFLQGQFRDSNHSYDYSDLRPLILEGWIGVSADLTDQLRASFIHRFQTSEIRSGMSDRSFDWGSLTISYFF